MILDPKNREVLGDLQDFLDDNNRSIVQWNGMDDKRIGEIDAFEAKALQEEWSATATLQGKKNRNEPISVQVEALAARLLR